MGYLFVVMFIVIILDLKIFFVVDRLIEIVIWFLDFNMYFEDVKYLFKINVVFEGYVNENVFYDG